MPDLRRSLVMVAVILIGLTAACHTPVPREDWPVRDDPLFRSTVWIDTDGKLASGVILHSSQRGTYILTCGHIIQDDDGIVNAEAVVDVGVYALSHATPIRDPYVMYPADVVATTAPGEESRDDAIAGSLAMIRWASLEDIAILRLRTDRRFLAAPLFTGSPDSVTGKAAVLIPVPPKMYPHRKPATCDAESVTCMTLVHGNSGAPVFVEEQVVGLGSFVAFGPGPKRLQEFVRKHEGIRFLLDEPNAFPGVTDVPDGGLRPKP